MAFDPYSGRPVVVVASPAPYTAMPVRVVDPAVVGPYGGMPVWPTTGDGQPVVLSTDVWAQPVYSVGDPLV